VRMPLTSMEQLLPFPTAGELLERRKTQVISVSPETTVLAAIQSMADEDIGFLPVLDGTRLVGVVSERDCARRVLLRQLPAAATPVRAIMTSEVESVGPEAKVPECIIRMHASGVRHLPVVRGGQLLGVLSVRDFMGALIERHERLLRKLHEERLTLHFPDPSSY
jgi:CBS domain-containing protein